MNKEEMIEELESLRQDIKNLTKKGKRFEVVCQENAALIETIKPGKLNDVKEQELKIESLRLNFTSFEKLQETIISQFKVMKNQVKCFNYKKTVELNKDMKNRLSNMEKLDANIEKNTRRMEHMFMAFEKHYIDFKALRTLGRKLEQISERYAEEFVNIARENEVKLLQEDIEEINQRISACVTEKKFEKLKNKIIKKRRWF